MSKHLEPNVIQDLILKLRLRNLDWVNDKQIYIEYDEIEWKKPFQDNFAKNSIKEVLSNKAKKQFILNLPYIFSKIKTRK